MSTTTTSQPATSSPLKLLIVRHPLVTFFVIAFAGAWITSLSFLLARSGFGILPFSLPLHVLPGLDLLTIGAFTGPTLAAFLVTALTSGAVGLQQLLRQIVQWRVGVGWYLLAFLGYPVIYVSIYSITLGMSSLPTILSQWPFLFTAYLPYLVVNLISTMGEEMGWVGYALPTLQRRIAPWLSAITLGVLWALWHLPAFFVIGALGPFAPTNFALLFVLGAAGRITWTWIFNETKGGVIIIALLHAASNGAGIALLPRLSPPAPSLGTLLFLGLTVVVFPVLIIILTRGRLSYKLDRITQSTGASRPVETPLTHV
jgi:uncharacterized protein